MKKNEVFIGGLYQVKVSGKLAVVRITAHAQSKGWHGVNLATGRSVRLKTAARLRAHVPITDITK